MKQSKQLNPRQINTTALAYIGDAVYEIYVREHVLAASGGNCAEVSGATSGTTAGKQKAYGAHVDALHRRAIRYVRADGQAKAIKAMLAEGFLTAEEEALVRRARNHKSASKPKNADAMDYKYATAFEALIGFWHLMARRGDEAGAESPAQGLPGASWQRPSCEQQPGTEQPATGAGQPASSEQPPGAGQPLPAAAGGRRRAAEAAKQRVEDIIFRTFEIIEGAAAPQNGRFDESLDYPKISERK